MAVFTWYGLAQQSQWDGSSVIDFDTDTVKVALVTTAYTPSQDTHDFWNDVNANELAAGGGYTAGGNTLGTKSVTYTAGTNRTALIAADTSWTFVGTKAFRYAVAYKDTGAAATSKLLGYSDLGAQSITDALFTLDFDQVNGLFFIDVT
jgi:hypothetical protein